MISEHVCEEEEAVDEDCEYAHMPYFVFLYVLTGIYIRSFPKCFCCG